MSRHRMTIDSALLRIVMAKPWPGDRVAGDRVRILIIDDSALARAGLRAFLATAPDLEVVGEAPSAQDALAAVEQLEPHVIVIDARAPGIDRFARRVSRSARAGAARLVVLTSSDL